MPAGAPNGSSGRSARRSIASSPVGDDMAVRQVSWWLREPLYSLAGRLDHPRRLERGNARQRLSYRCVDGVSAMRRRRQHGAPASVSIKTSVVGPCDGRRHQSGSVVRPSDGRRHATWLSSRSRDRRRINAGLSRLRRTRFFRTRSDDATAQLVPAPHHLAISFTIVTFDHSPCSCVLLCERSRRRRP